LAIRSVAYCQHPDKPDVEPRITRQIFDEAGREVAAWDPRLWGLAPKPNLSTVYALSGQVLLTDSVDAGWQLNLCNDAGSQRSFWDERGSQCHREFDDLQRPVALTEQAFGEQLQVVERWTYADATESFAQHNQCGQLIRHDDPGGGQFLGDYGWSGAVLEESRRFLIELDAPDWPLLLDARDELLEEKAYVTRYALNPTGEVQRQIDAAGNAQTFHFNVAGKSSATWLLQSGEGQHPQCLVSEIRYNAQDQIESETAGNGVVSSVDYSPEDGRLLRLFAGVVGQQPLQDLNYAYDPVGNIVELEDKCQTVSHFNGQRIDPVSRYRYDSLYQLVEAKGWEVSKPSHGPALPDLLPVPLDPAQRRNYTQTFTYDAAGNLITRHHSGAPGFSMFTSARSNRSLAQLDDGSLPGEAQITLGFDTAGNQLELQRGQAMTWNVRNELRRVTLVQRGAEVDDFECYVYDQPGHRLRKTQISRASGQTLTTEVRYLPGLEIHCEVGGVERHVVSVDAGRNQVRLLHWPAGAESDQWRYSLGDHLGSSSMELDESAGILSQEYFYAFGGTACWAGKSTLTAKYKSIRYSSKERDSTGLYYYGFRYYAPWLQRWVNPDPAGFIDGFNMFLFAVNNPVRYIDSNGLVRGEAGADTKSLLLAEQYGRQADSAFEEYRVAPSSGAKFRQIGQVIINRNSELKALSGFVVNADVQTSPGRSFFWSGDSLDLSGSVDKSALMTAQFLAGIQGGMTIEMTPGGETLESYGKNNWPPITGGRSTPGFKYLQDRFRYVPAGIRESLLAKGALSAGKNIYGVIGLNFFDTDNPAENMINSPLKSVAGIVWDVVSIRFARGAVGAVNVIHAAKTNDPYFQSDTFLRSTWLTKEKVALINEAKTTIVERFGEHLRSWELQKPKVRRAP
jgi:insecticidal toxin complex protein TccC